MTITGKGRSWRAKEGHWSARGKTPEEAQAKLQVFLDSMKKFGQELEEKIERDRNRPSNYRGTADEHA